MYDIFISFKNKDIIGEETEDSLIANQIYDELKKRDISVFLSKYEIDKNGRSLWRDEIDKALLQAKHLVLVGTSVENIYSGQVKYEWDVFLEDIIANKKPDGSLIPYFKNIDIRGLHRKVSKWQIYDISSTPITALCDLIEQKLPDKNYLLSNSENRTDNEQILNLSATYRNRFNYRSGYTHVVGRDEEFKFLRRFCVGTNDMLSWTVISGKGGTGKSKLAYEFCSFIESYGWRAYRPHHAKSFIREDLVSIDRDVLICFDYVKFELEQVESVIQFVIDQRIRHKVRIVLIERDGTEVKSGFSLKASVFHNKEGDIQLECLTEDALLSLVDDYITNLNIDKKLTEDDKRIIYDTLNIVDPVVLRPLFAMFIADAWADGNDDLQNWDRESAVKFIANKELDRFISVATNNANNPAEKKQYTDGILSLIAYATFVGEVPVEFFEQSTIINTSIPAHKIYQMIKDCELLENDFVSGIEPDLVGEYVTLNILSELESSKVKLFFSELYQNHFTEMISYLDKIYDDYTDTFMAADWSSYAKTIIVPLSFTYIRNNMFNGCGFIQEVILHDEVTTVSNGGFRNCDHLKSINFPDNLEIIGNAAFANCVALENAVPNDEKGWAPSIISIGDRAFKNCRQLKEFRVPRSVKEIGAGAFAKCAALERIEIPIEVTTIKHNAFEDCASMREVSIKSKGVIEIKNEAFKGCFQLSKIRESSRISYIGKSAFENCKALIDISLGHNLKDMAESAFKGCVSIENIDLSDTVLTRINKSVFDGCKNLRSVILPTKLSYIGAKGFNECISLNDIKLPEKTKNIGELAFNKCTSLNTDSFGENIKTVVEFCAFYLNEIDDNIIKFVVSYYDERHIVLPEKIYQIGYRAFFSNYKLEEIKIHSKVSGIGPEAFRGCVNLKTIQGSLASLSSIGEKAFVGCKSLEYIPKIGCVSEINESVFRYCIALKRIKFNTRIDKIGKGAFSHCYSLQGLFFKDKCKYISASAFQGCVNFYLSGKYHIRNDKGLYYVCGFIFNRLERKELFFINNYTEWEKVKIPFSCIGFFENPFEHTPVKEIIIPNSIKKLIKKNFANTKSLEKIKLPKRIKQIPEGTFEGCESLNAIFISNDKNVFQDDVILGERAFSNCYSLECIKLPNGTIDIKNQTFLNCKSLTKVDLNDGLKVIGVSAFEGCESLVTLSLPTSVRQIKYAAFKDCASLEQIDGLENTSIADIRGETFRGCTSLNRIVLPKSLKSVGAYAFFDCMKLGNVNLFGTNTSYIGISAFQNCYMLQECTLPRKVIKIKKFTFKHCSLLQKIRISPDLEEIGTSAFFGCNMLEDIDLQRKQKLWLLGNDAFYGCHKIKEMVLPEGIRKLTRGLFRGCATLKSVKMSADIRTIPADCFKDCKSLEKVELVSEISSVGAGAFRNCFALKDFSFLENVKYIEAAAFRGCTSVEKAAFNCINEVPASLFMGCKRLTTVDFHQVNQVDNYAFYGCTELANVHIANIKTRIGDGAFWNCNKLKEVVFSETMFDILPSAFRNCTSIERIVFPNGIQKIYAASFRNATNMRFISLPSTTKEIHKSAFKDCTLLEEVNIESEQILIESSSFEGCAELRYLDFAGNIEAQQSAFCGTPIEEALLEDDRITWVEKTERQQYHVESKTSDARDISATSALRLFLYSMQDGEIHLDKYIGKDTIINVPDRINGNVVGHIAESCFEDRPTITEINLPSSIKTIGNNAFAGCRGLSKITLSENTVQIGDFAFKWCDNLKSLIVPNISEISPGSFMCCYKLEEIDIPDSVKKIGEGAFWKCENITLSIPESVEEIETGAFKGVCRDNVHIEKDEPRYYQEWPFGEIVQSSEYGKGVITTCDYKSKNRYCLGITYDGGTQSIIYPDEFNDKMRFTTEDAEARHSNVLTKIRSKLNMV